jgi:DNA-binding LytR/AlgR family response regulator
LKISCIIVEDEPLSSNILERYCSKHPDLELAASFPAAEPALEFLKTTETSIVFLDVQLPGINGFEFLDQLPFSPKIILTTSDTSFAFTAFQYHVTDYLKKPISYPRFEAAVAKAMSAGILQDAGKSGNDLFIRSEGKYVRMNYADILYIESMGDYVKYVTPTGEHITHNTLKNAFTTLDHQQFMKVHRCYIVRLEKVTDVTDKVLRVGTIEIPVSKNCKTELQQRLHINR